MCKFTNQSNQPIEIIALSLCCVCVVIPSILDVRLVDVPAGVTQEEGHTGFFRLPSAVLAFILPARRTQPSLSLVDREVELCVLRALTNAFNFS